MMTKKTKDAKKIAEHLDSIQEGFHKVLADHGLHNLRISSFRLSDVKHDESIAADATAADSDGCWKRVCEMTSTGPRCHYEWDPNC